MIAAAAICLASTHPAAADDRALPKFLVAAPSIPTAAASAPGFAPPGWKVEQTLKGDLNKDGRPDLVAILKGADPNCIVQPRNVSDPIDTNPRVLLVAFAGNAGYTLHLANTAVIPRLDNPDMQDPLNIDAFAIGGGVIRLGFTFWLSAGGWTTTSNTLSFRWDGSRFRLISLKREHIARDTGKTEGLSVDFLTQRARISNGSIEEDGPAMVRWQVLPLQKPETLETIGNGLNYEPKL